MNEGMFNQIKGLLGELIKRHDRLIELVESQMTQPLEDMPVDAQAVANERRHQEHQEVLRRHQPPEPIVQVDERTANEMDKASAFEPVKRFGESTQQSPQTWPAQEQNKPKPERTATGAPMRPAKK